MNWRRDGPVLLLAMVFPALATWLYFVALAGRPSMRPAYAACKVAQFALPLAWVALVQGRAVRPERHHGRGIPTGLLFGLGVLGAVLLLYVGVLRSSEAFAEFPARLRAKLADIGADTPARFLGLAVFLSILHSFLEEYYWRWFVFGQLQRGMPWTRAASISGLAFMAHHVIVIDAYLAPGHFWTVAAPLSLGVAAGGFAWAWLYHRTGSLYGPWLSHLLADAGLMIIGYDWVWGTAG